MAKTIRESPLWDEIQDVMKNGSKAIQYHWTAVLRAKEIEYDTICVLSVDNDRNFHGRYADHMFVEVAVQPGTFYADIFPHNDTLEIILTRTPKFIAGSTETPDEAPMVQTYRASIVNPKNPLVTMKQDFGDNKEAMNLSDVARVTFQVFDHALEQLMMKTVNQGATRSRPGGLARWILTNLSKDIEVDDEYKITGVSIVDYSNQEPRPLVRVPAGTRFVDAPLYLHEHEGGIYSAGMGYYLHGRAWYMYPSYDVTRFNTARPKLTVIAVPADKLPGVERTFMRDNTHTTIIATGGIEYLDPTEGQKLSEGNGVRYNDSRNVMEAYGEVEGNKLKVDNSLNTTEYVTEQRENGLNNVQTGARKFTSNPFVESSLLAKRNGAYVQVVWENSSVDMIEPNMPVRYMYVQGGDVKEAMGTLAQAHMIVEPTQQGITFGSHVQKTILTIFIGSKLDWAQVTNE